MSLVTTSGWTTRFLAAAVAVGLSAAGAFGQVYSNTTPITNIGNLGTSAPYPSTITVAGGPVSVSGVRVTIFGLTHFVSRNINLLLVAPDGQKIMLMSASLDGGEVTDLTFSFSTFSTTILTGTPASGPYAPTGPNPGSGDLTAPAPAGPYGNSFAPLTGTNANGNWSLYVDKPTCCSIGSISGGWRIEFGDAPEANTAPSPNALTYQGRLTGGPANGAIDARFSLWNHESSANSFDRIGDPVTVSGVALSGGLFTATADLGRVPNDRKTWLQVEVANPAGSAFVTLTPRQPMTFAPLANTPAYNTTTVDGIHSVTNRGVKALSGYDALNGEFNGMKAIVAAGTNFCGNTGDVAFFTWECNTATSREIVRINGRGNVGIGTDAPTQKLHVIGNILASGTITPSCGALKQNIKPMRDALDRIASLDAVRFDWKPDEAKIRGFTHDLGFIAEDVAKVFPEVVFRDQQGAIIGLDYARMSAVAVGAIKQLKSENDRITADNAELKARLEKIEAMLAKQAAQEVRP